MNAQDTIKKMIEENNVVFIYERYRTISTVWFFRTRSTYFYVNAALKIF